MPLKIYPLPGIPINWCAAPKLSSTSIMDNQDWAAPVVDQDGWKNIDSSLKRSVTACACVRFRPRMAEASQLEVERVRLRSQAVREFEGRYFVIVQDGEAQRRVDVKVGIIEEDRIEITEGLAEGQVVV